MEFNSDTRQVVIDHELYNSLRVMAMFGTVGDEERGKRLEMIDRHAIKFNLGLRDERDKTRAELAESTANIIRQERRAHRMSSMRHQQTYYVKTFSGRWVPVKVIGINRGLYALEVEPLTLVGSSYTTWRMQADAILYEHELVQRIEAQETPDEILRYTLMMEKYRVPS